MQMKKFITMCLSAAVLLGAASAQAITIPQQRALAKEGKVIKAYDGRKHHTPQNLKKAPTSENRGIVPLQKAPTNPLLKKKPARVTASGSDLYGWSVYSTADNPVVGYYSVDASTLTPLWADPFYAEQGYTLQDGVLLNGVLYGNAVYQSLFGISAANWNVYDAATGEMTSSEELDIFADAPCFLRMAYNSADEYLYGIGYSVSYDGATALQFMKAPLSNPSQGEVICAVTDEINVGGMCYSEPDDCFYGINMQSDLVKFTADGNSTVISHIDLTSYGFNPGYYFGMVYSPVEGLIYFNPNAAADSYIGTINPQTGDVTIDFTTPNGNQLMFMVTADEFVSDPLMPAKPVIKETAFMEGSLSGWNIYTMPTTLADGTAITEPMKLYTLLDGEDYRSYDAQPGEDVRVTYPDLTTGFHNFAAYVDVNGHQSRKASNRVYVGFDIPSAPANVVLSENGVDWDHVFTSVNGGYVNYSDLVYTVYINGEKYGETNAPETHLDITLPEGQDYQLYRASVTASWNDVVSEAGESNGVAYGNAWKLPVDVVPTAEQAALCQFVDANGDGSCVSFSQGETEDENCFQFGWNPYNEMDDWLFLPAIAFPEGKYIPMSFDAGILSTSYGDEVLSVYIGKEATPEAMTTCVVDEFTPNDGENTNYETVNATIDVKGGEYVIGFHCTSAADQLGLRIRNIQLVDRNITAASPAEISNLEAEAADNGALNAKVSFNLPTKNLGGEAIADDAEIVATVSSAIDTKTVKGAPGARVSVDVETEQCSMSYVNPIEVYSSLGEFNSPISTTTVYTGVYCPTTPSNVKSSASDDMKTETITWDPVTAPYEEGGYFDPAGVTYSFYDSFVFWGMTFYTLVEEGITDTTYSFSYEGTEEAPMIFTDNAISAENAAGNCGYITLVPSQLLGSPYQLPIEDDLSTGNMNLSPWLIYRLSEEYTATWVYNYISDIVEVPDVDPQSTALACSGEAGSKGALCAPRFSTADVDKAFVTVTAYTGPECPETTIYGRCMGSDELIEIGGITATEVEGMSTLTFELPEALIGKYWVEIIFDCTFTADDQVFAFNYFAASAEAPEGSTVAVADITNNTGVYAGKGTITVCGYEGQNVTISNLEGAMVVNSPARSTRSVYTLDKGVYVVKVADRKLKVVVR